MKRKIPVLVALALGGIISAFCLPGTNLQFPKPSAIEGTTLRAADRENDAGVIPTGISKDSPKVVTSWITPPQNTDEITPRAHPTRRQLRISAIRDGHIYGWIELPHGTPVDFVRDEGSSMLVRYDEVFLRIPRAAAQQGIVVLRKRNQAPVRA